MKDVTQGTLIYGMRSTKYPGVVTYGVLISAACDLEQEKIDKVFYLTAIPLDHWLYSNKGYQVVTAGLVKSCKKSLADCVEKHELSWDVVQTLSQEEFEIIVADNIKSKSERTSAISKFCKYKGVAKETPTLEEKLDVYRDDKKAISGVLEDIFNGANTHFVFVPKKALSDSTFVGQGLIVDLLELDYLSIELVKRIARGEIDVKVLDECEKTSFDERFFIKEYEGYAYPEGDIIPPWREYVLQHFSNCFIRIGVDNPGKSEVRGMVDTLVQKEN